MASASHTVDRDAAETGNLTTLIWLVLFV